MGWLATAAQTLASTLLALLVLLLLCHIATTTRTHQLPRASCSSTRPSKVTTHAGVTDSLTGRASGASTHGRQGRHGVMTAARHDDGGGGGGGRGGAAAGGLFDGAGGDSGSSGDSGSGCGGSGSGSGSDSSVAGILAGIKVYVRHFPRTTAGHFVKRQLAVACASSGVPLHQLHHRTGLERAHQAQAVSSSCSLPKPQRQQRCDRLPDEMELLCWHNTGIHPYYPQEVRRHCGCAVGGRGATSAPGTSRQSHHRRSGQPGGQRQRPESCIDSSSSAPHLDSGTIATVAVGVQPQRRHLAPTPGTCLVGGIRRPGQRATRLLLRVSAGGRDRQVQHAGAGRYREVQRCCGCGLWGEQEGVLLVRLVPVQDVCRVPTPDVARLPAAGRRGRSPIQAVRLSSHVCCCQWWAGDCSW
jgi:hypothetical protein